jgi:hypothetical protein
MKILFYLILIIFILFSILFFYTEHFEVTHLKPECFWNTQGILRCNEVPTFENIPKEQLKIESGKQEK